MNELALFAGAGGGILGGKILGWRTVCAVEWEPYPASVLCARQNEGLLPPFPIWDDVQTFDGRPWRGIVDVISGGFPCQDISIAGKGDGLDGERSSMWNHMARVVGEVRPQFVFVENSPMLTIRGGPRVIADLTEMGYHTAWTVMGAADVGAPHQRDRIWIVGKHTDTQCMGWQEGAIEQETLRKQNKTDNPSDICETQSNAQMVNAEFQGLERHWPYSGQQKFPEFGHSSWWQIEPDVGRVAHGLADRVDRLKAIGNGQVPLCAATAFRILSEML